VTCEDIFSLHLPEHGADACSTSTSNNNGGASALSGGAAAASGDGCYVSALIHNRRYYGVLFDQEALKAATKQHFTNEANSLELNNRMQSLASVRILDTTSEGDADDNTITEAPEPDAKRQRTDVSDSGKNSSESIVLEDDNKSVEKLRLIEPKGSSAHNTNGQPYRELVATYASISAASEDDKERALLIQDACRSGGGWVGKYYYHYEDFRGIMDGVTMGKSHGTRSYRLSMGMDTFLRNTSLDIPGNIRLEYLPHGFHRQYLRLSERMDEGFAARR